MIGDAAWIVRTDGNLSRREELTHQAKALRVLVADLPGRLRFLRDSSDDAPFDVDIDVPDTALARAATAWVAQTHDPWLLNHCLRTWAFAVLLGRTDDIEANDEMLYLACLLHDVGLTDEGRIGPGEACGCFAVHGAQAARDKLVELGADPLLAAEVADAIGLHLNATVPLSHGPTAHLLSAGAGLDVVGIRAADLGRAAVTAVLRAHERAGFVDSLLAVFRRELAVRSRGRLGAFWRGGFPLAIRLNPLNRLH